MRNPFFLSFLLLFLSKLLIGQTPQDSSFFRQSLEPVQIIASRIETKDLNTPLAISVLDKNYLQKGQQQLSLSEMLGASAGVFTFDASNFAQDLRVSIRGFGARAAFGIRGIKILVDGVPLSTPDGQADVDNLTLNILGRMELVKGNASGLYGNASGGVMNFYSETPTEKPFLELQTTFGQYGFQQYHLKTGQQRKQWSYLLNATHVENRGYRVHSEMKSSVFATKLQYKWDESTKINLFINYANSPLANDAGALTSKQVEENRQQARPQNLQFDGGEALQQAQSGISFEKNWQNKHQLTLKGFYTYRDFSNRLAFQASGLVEFLRQFGGVGAQYLYKKAWNTANYQFKTGFDLEKQKDFRQRFDNVNGKKGGKVFEQDEIFANQALYCIQNLDFKQKINALFSIRYDQINIQAKDYFLNNGDQSGKRNFQQASYLLGFSIPIQDKINPYFNIGSNFETPSLSELSNNPTNQGGLADLAPQKAFSTELGLKGILDKKLRYSLALFNIQLKNELVPYQLATAPGRVFYRNAGSSDRKGVELDVTYAFAKGFLLLGNMTFSDFRYKNYETLAGKLDNNVQPGIPKWNSFIEMRYQSPKGFWCSLQSKNVGKLFADDANSVTTVPYQLINLKTAYTHSFGRQTFEYFLGVNNLFNAAYFGNIQINAAAGRYFEPNVLRNFYGGVKVRFDGK